MPADSRLTAALTRLVERGVLTDDQAHAVAEEVHPPLPETLAEHPDERRGRIAEVAGYVGAALVAGATILFLSQSWDDLSKLGRVAVLLGIAAVLAAAGLLVANTAEGPLRALREGADPVRARLASTLFSAGAVSAAFAAGFIADTGEPDRPAPLLAAGATGAVLAALGYLVAPAAVAQVAIVGSTLVAGFGALLFIDDGEEYLGLVVLGVGAAWAVLAGIGQLRERRFGAGLGAALSLLGAQWIIVVGSLQPWVSYVLTALVAAACFAAYAWQRSWPYLVVGVAGATLAVTEFVLDVTEGTLGAAGALLIAGMTLLAASALGLRLRRTVSGGT